MVALFWVRTCGLSVFCFWVVWISSLVLFCISGRVACFWMLAVWWLVTCFCRLCGFACAWIWVG